MIDRLKNLSIGIKMLSIVGLCLSALAGIAALAVAEVSKLGGELESIAERDIPLTEIISDTTVHQLEQAINFERAVRYGESMAQGADTAEQFEHAVSRFTELAELVDHEIKVGEEIAAEAIASARSEQELTEFQHVLEILKKIEAEHAEFDRLAFEGFDLLSRGQLVQARELTERIEVVEEALDHELEALLKEIVRFTAQAALTAEADEKAAIELIIWSAVIVLLTVAVLSWLLVRSVIIRPLGEVVGAIESLISGNTETTVTVRSNDEIGKVAQALEVFRGKLLENKELEAQAAEQKETLSRERREARLKMADDLEQSVGSIVETVSSASTEMQATAQSMTATAEETTAQATAVAAASEEASSNVNTVAAATEELSCTVNEITKQVTTSTEITNKAVAEANKTTHTVQGMAEAAEKVGQIISLISDIAEQTNLLALNATIEAARAGEAGKGFAVVASEVKSLATQTAKATEEISAQISNMQSITEDTVTAIESISGTITEVNGIASGIAAAVEEQGASTQEIARNVQEAAQGTQEVSSNIAGVTQAASESGASASQVLAASGELSVQSEKLRQEVNRFLAEIRAA
ncbi:MAG: methyl-accepting chemotaxis protein [Pseudomonadota bacterium]